MDNLITALIQIPFIAAFIWFAVRMSNDYRRDAKERDAHWMEFLKIEREQRKHAMEQGMNEVQMMTEGMNKLAKGVAEHDTKAVERYEKLREIIKNGN
ncbi:MAG: hypothetical protein GTO02_21505 [Candidatus Dadabacteria bacterium]|nr:hypothetical protein [Candidatus Dadabacteria bacterium]